MQLQDGEDADEVTLFFSGSVRNTNSYDFCWLLALDTGAFVIKSPLRDVAPDPLLQSRKPLSFNGLRFSEWFETDEVRLTGQQKLTLIAGEFVKEAKRWWLPSRAFSGLWRFALHFNARLNRQRILAKPLVEVDPRATVSFPQLSQAADAG
uniref:Peptidase A1 domain-containing protein n=1 Tax=Ascaris lumbricoides TaxID=6252 RepID=A0A9J2PDP0_ASCLU